MGNIVESCACKIDCCDNFNQDKTENYFKKIDDEEEKKEDDDADDEEEKKDDDDDEYSMDEEEHLDIIKESKKCFFLPSDIQNMKLRANLLLEHKTDPWSLYKELGVLGKGSYGVVKKVCLKKNPKIIRAIKIIEKDHFKSLEKEKLLDEIKILKNLDHPNIVKLYEFFEDEKNYYMVSEYCDQGDLFDKMEKLLYMNQIVVKLLMEQILNAVAYLHSKGVCHGDIKLENIMLYTTTNKSNNERFTLLSKQLIYDKTLEKEIDNTFKYGKKGCLNSKSLNIVQDMLKYEIKLIDFGCSKIFSKRGERKSGIIGTSAYCSPEIIDNLYDEKCDEWACGVLMYLLICGNFPFDGNNEKEIFEKIKKCEYDFSSDHFRKVSKNCINLIKKLLEPKLSRRIKAIDALKHPFFTESFNPDKALTLNKDESVIRQLSDITVPHSQFHRAVLSYMSANYISKDEEAELRKVFRFIDSDRKSYLTKTKIEKTLKENGNLCTVQEIDDIIKALDIDRNGVIEYQEYIQGLCDKQALFSEINLKDLFTYMDNDNKGYLTSEDIKNFAFQNKTVNDEAFKEYLKQFGMKIDDKLNFDDFLYIIQNNCSLNNRNENIKLQTKKSEKTIIFKSYSNIYTDIDEESSDLSEEDNSNNKSTQNSDLRNGKYFAKK
jgi:calcium-dependent protein kinase